MYKDFVTMCETRLLEGSVLDALYLYSSIDYLKLISPQLAKRKNKVDINVLEPISSDLILKTPRFKHERESYIVDGSYPKINQYSLEDDQSLKFRVFNEQINQKNEKMKYRAHNNRKYISKKV